MQKERRVGRRNAEEKKVSSLAKANFNVGIVTI
jgi:hypothetical protein